MSLVGREASREVVISEELVRAFADVVGDHNPIHLDHSAAEDSRFGRPIAHGMLVGSLFSGLIASELPGPGSVYISQSLRFRRPTPVGARVRVVIRCTDVTDAKATLETAVIDTGGERLVVGEAVVLLPQ